jgi:hypothetical protein
MQPRRSRLAKAPEAPGVRKELDAALGAYPDDVELRLLRGNAEERSAAGIGQRGGASTIPIHEAVLARVPTISRRTIT